MRFCHSGRGESADRRCSARSACSRRQAEGLELSTAARRLGVRAGRGFGCGVGRRGAARGRSDSMLGRVLVQRWRPPCAGSGKNGATALGSFTMLGPPRGQRVNFFAAPPFTVHTSPFCLPRPPRPQDSGAIQSTASPFLQPSSSPDFLVRRSSQLYSPRRASPPSRRHGLSSGAATCCRAVVKRSHGNAAGAYFCIDWTSARTATMA